MEEVRESMAITRRQFVTRLGTLAAAMGMSQVDLAKITDAFAHGAPWTGAWTNKPKVVWVHGAECTGCSTSLLSLFEDVRGTAVEGTSISTLMALDLAVGGDGDGSTVLPPALGGDVDPNHPNGHRTLNNAGADFDAAANGGAPFVANIADVLIDFIDLQYHETVMSMGGDLAYQWLKDTMDNAGAPFVLVVEGSVQPSSDGGYWGAEGIAPWCAIGMSEADDGHGHPVGEHDFDHVVATLAVRSNCVAVIPIGQCAAFGGYPACESPVLKRDALGLANGANQTGAMGVYDYLLGVDAAAANKVINVPGCPTNPWWFILTVVAWLVDFAAPGTLGIHEGGVINAGAVDNSRRLKAVYGQPLHGPYCTRINDYAKGKFARVPGDSGCLQILGCMGPQTMTLCGPHGWNSQHPQNDPTWDYGVAGVNGGKGGNCITAGAPCMGCTEKGYPDAFLPFVVR